MIEDILGSKRQGRNLEGFDEIYSDPNVKNALEQGNDTIARTYIKDKLCTLGLMNVRILYIFYINCKQISNSNFY